MRLKMWIEKEKKNKWAQQWFYRRCCLSREKICHVYVCISFIFLQVFHRLLSASWSVQMLFRLKHKHTNVNNASNITSCFVDNCKSSIFFFLFICHLQWRRSIPLQSKSFSFWRFWCSCVVCKFFFIVRWWFVSIPFLLLFFICLTHKKKFFFSKI